MENENMNSRLLDAMEGLKAYFVQQITYNKLLLSKRISALSGGLFLFIILSGITGLAMLFLSFAFAYWYAYKFGNTFEGFLILAAFYIILAALIIIFRKQWMYNPLRRITGGILFAEDESEEYDENDGDIHPDVFRSKQRLDETITKSHEDLTEKENELKEVFEEVSQQFTFKGITQSVFKSAYNSYFTTANIARATYILFSKLRGKKKHKKRKKLNK